MRLKAMTAQQDGRVLLSWADKKVSCACIQCTPYDHHALGRLRVSGGPAVGRRQRRHSVLSCVTVISWRMSATCATTGVAAAERLLPWGPGRPHGLWSPRLQRRAGCCPTAAATVRGATAAGVGPCTPGPEFQAPPKLPYMPAQLSMVSLTSSAQGGASKNTRWRRCLCMAAVVFCPSKGCKRCVLPGVPSLRPCCGDLNADSGASTVAPAHCAGLLKVKPPAGGALTAVPPSDGDISAHRALRAAVGLGS